MENFKETLKLISALFVISYVINLAWEFFHSFLYNIPYHMGGFDYLMMLMKATFGDAVIILAIYLIISASSKDFLWIKNPNKKQMFFIIAAGFLVAVLIEVRALYFTGKWSYNEYMPAIFTIGLTPLIQLSLTALISIWVARRLIYKL